MRQRKKKRTSQEVNSQELILDEAEFGTQQTTRDDEMRKELKLLLQTVLRMVKTLAGMNTKLDDNSRD